MPLAMTCGCRLHNLELGPHPPVSGTSRSSCACARAHIHIQHKQLYHYRNQTRQSQLNVIVAWIAYSTSSGSLNTPHSSARVCQTLNKKLYPPEILSTNLSSTLLLDQLSNPDLMPAPGFKQLPMTWPSQSVCSPGPITNLRVTNCSANQTPHT